MSGSAFSGNSARSGGAIFNHGGGLVVTNSTLSGNSAESGSAVYSYQALTLSLYNSIVAFNDGSDLVGQPDRQWRESSLIGIDPCFVRNPGTNGPDDYGDLRLTDTSPAIDAGKTGRLLRDYSDADVDGNTSEPLPIDMDANPRVVGAAVDIGAYEFQGEISGGREPVSTVVTTVSDSFNLYDGKVSLREAVYYAMTDSAGTTVTFETDLSGLSIDLNSAIEIQQSMTIDASSLPKGIVLDAGGRNRVLQVFTEEDETVDLIGLSVTGGRAPEEGENALPGGGIFCVGALRLIDSSVSANSTDGEGGGVYSDGTVTVVGSDFYGNSAGGRGGAIRANAIEVVNSLFRGNSADKGGAICTTTLDMVNSIISGNSANLAGGACGLHHSDSRMYLVNSVLAGNSQASGSDYSDIAVSSSYASRVSSSSNPVDPFIFRVPDAGPDGIWGTGDDDYGDLRLLPVPQIVDVGSNSALPPDEFDLDGDGDVSEPIPFDFEGNPRVENGTVDIGAYETPILEYHSIIYVDADAAPGGYGTSWDSALTALQPALSIAASFNSDSTTENDIDQIWIAEGIYRPDKPQDPDNPRSATFRLPDGVTLYGGFDGTETDVAERDWTAHETILCGDIGIADDASDNAYTVVYCGAEVEAVVDGVTITDGNADGSSGNETASGGGVFTEGILLIANSIVSHNRSVFRGGGICCPAGSVSLNCTSVVGNSATYMGGGIYCTGTSIDILNSVLVANSAPTGGAASMLASTIRVVNSTIAGNTSDNGVFLVAVSANFALANSIVALNPGGDLTMSSPEIATNNLIAVDPGFVRNPLTNGPDDYGDLRLAPHSAAIDAGTNALVSADVWDVDQDGDTEEPLPFDITGRTRFRDASVDIGAYEYEGTAPGSREMPSTVVTTALDTYNPYDGKIALREAIHHAETASLGATVTFSPELSGETIVLAAYGIQLERSISVDASSLPGGITINGDHKSRIFTITAPEREPVELIGLTVQGGYAHEGGGIYNSGNLTLVSCSVEECSANKKGGAIYSVGTLALTHCVVSGNSAFGASQITLYDGGGGIYGDGPVTVTNCVVVANSAKSYGGGICNASGNLTVLNCTIAANLTTAKGGGVYIDGTAEVDNTIVAGNRDRVGLSDLYCESSASLSGYYNLIGIESGQSSLRRYNGNLVSTPTFRFLPYFIREPSDGGDGWGDDPETQNVDESVNDDYGDLRLRADSPAIDAGNSTLLPSDMYDLDGDGNTDEPLPFALYESHRVFGGQIDIGADEYQYTPDSGRETPSTGVTTALDVLDPYDGLISLREAVAYAKTEPIGTTISFSPSLSGSTILLEGLSILLDRSVTIDASSLSGGISIDAGEQSRAFAVIAQTDEPVELIGLTIRNGRSGYGGGIYNSGMLTMTHCTICENTVTEDGGAIYNEWGILAMANCIVAENIAEYGGGVYMQNGNLTMTNSTVSRNSAWSTGGVYLHGTRAVLNNTMIAQNHGLAPDIQMSGSLLEGSHNLIGDETGQSAFSDGVSGNLIGTSDAPLDPMLSDWTKYDNGRWGFHLLPDSPALNSGDNELAIDGNGQPLDRDIRGYPRIGEKIVDIGAVEGVTMGIPARHYLVTSLEQEIVSDGVLTFIEAFEAANRNEPVGDAPAGSFSECDVIQFAEGVIGTIVLENGELTTKGTLSIEGPGSEFLTFDAGGRNRVFLVRPASSLDLHGVTVTGGHAEDGGAIYNRGTLAVRGSIITENTASGDGGGVYNAAGNLTIVDSALSQNTGGNGGGISDCYGTTNVVNSLFVQNVAIKDGGGINVYYGALRATNSTFQHNLSEWNGGGADTDYATAELSNCDFLANSAHFSGGGINSNSGTLRITNSTLLGNSSEERGGGIYKKYGLLTIENSTLSCNAAQMGGGICTRGTSLNVNLNNTILGRNSAGERPDLYHISGVLSGSNNFISDGIAQEAFVDGESGNLVGTTESPLDPLFIRNPSDGGDGWGDDPDTPDVDESLNDDYGDLRLRPTSPAIDAGNNALLPPDSFDLDADGDTSEPIPFDLAGNPRIQDGDADGIATVDIGAYEFFAVPAIPGDLNNDGFVGTPDLDIVRANWGQSVSAGSLYDGDPSGDGTVGTPDLDIVRANWGQTVPVAASARPDRMGDSPETPTEEALIGPRRRPVAAPIAPRDAVFADTRAWAEAAWAEAIEGLKGREKKHEAAAADLALAFWGEGA